MSRSNEKRLDDMRDMCIKVEALVERGRSVVEADDLLWGIASDDFPRVAAALGPSST